MMSKQITIAVVFVILFAGFVNAEGMDFAAYDNSLGWGSSAEAPAFADLQPICKHNKQNTLVAAATAALTQDPTWLTVPSQFTTDSTGSYASLIKGDEANMQLQRRPQANLLAITAVR